MIFWKMWALAMTIWITTAVIMRNLIPYVNRFADRALVSQQELFVLGIWILLFGLIVRRIEEEKFWKLWLFTFALAVWWAFLFSEASKGFLATS
jgi:hypothetical protein